MIDPKMIEKIEAALGHKLQDWQKVFLTGIGDVNTIIYPRHCGRTNGKVYVAMLKLLLDDSVKEFVIEDMPPAILKTHGKYIIEMNDKLTSAGIKTNAKPKEEN